MTRVVVVGHGMAGSRLVQELRARDPQHRLAITVVGAEPQAAYNRVLLSSVLAGKATAEGIRLAEPSWHEDADVDVRSGVTVVRVDRATRTVVTDDGARTAYDVLVLATGSRAVVPPLDGLTQPDGSLLPGAVAFRTLGDCEAIVRLAAGARRAVVVGGGLLGLEAARGLAGRGLDVEVLHRSAYPMERQLDPGAGRVLLRTLSALGVRVRVGARSVAVTGAESGRVEGVVLEGGDVVPADLLVLACGVAPETALAADAGLAVDRGVVVDDQMRTSDPAVFALGECAQHAGLVYGLVAPAWEQATVLADVLTGADPAARYAGSRVVTRLKAAGVELAAMGDTQAALDEADGPGAAEVLQFADPARGTYKKVVIRDGRLVGAILLGDLATVGTVTQIFDRGSVVPADRLALMFAGARGADAPAETPARIPDRATVCRCNGVTKGEITACWLAGARSVDAVAAACRATTGCGTCRDTVEGLVDWLADAEEPAPFTSNGRPQERS